MVQVSFNGCWGLRGKIIQFMWYLNVKEYMMNRLNIDNSGHGVIVYFYVSGLHN